jgi:protein phosphatase
MNDLATNDMALFDTAARTDVGKTRTHNEDNFLTRPEIGLWAVADGMGGHAAGDLASAAVVEELGRIALQGSAADLLKACETGLAEAHEKIRGIAAEKGVDVIGTTVVTLLTFGAHFACLWSGDSRVYLIRDGAITQVTRDHTEAQELVDRGVLTEAEARTWPRRNVITRAIGVFDAPELDLQHGDLLPGDIFVLCSDGLTAHVETEEIPSLVLQGDAQAACDQLIDLTLERGARDNVTVVVVRYRAAEKTTITLPQRPATGLWE